MTDFSWLSIAPAGKFWDTIRIRLQLLLSKSFPILYSLIILLSATIVWAIDSIIKENTNE
jgi:hypothetical protein